MENRSVKTFVDDLSALIRARYPLIYLQTYEEQRCLGVIEELSQSRGSSFLVWSRTEGVKKSDKAVSDIKDPMGVLAWYDELPERSVLVLKDYHPYLKEPAIIRKLRDLSHSLKRSQKNLLFLSPLLQLPPELSKEMVTLELPLPNREEIESLVQRATKILPSAETLAAKEMNGVIDAANGLTGDEIENVLAKSLVARGKLDKRLIQEEKKEIVKKSGLLEFVETESSGTPAIGGLGQLKGWLRTRRGGFSPEARALKLPLPKGLLLVGIPGCGKSLTAVTVGREWEMPLLRLDLGKIFSGLVGSSEGNIRNAIATCEAVSPCILWIDEIEKGLSGIQSSGSSDGGTSSRVFGTILTWMQEKRSPVFVVATANDISQLPPELLRKGRFDEIFFVDLPSASEREEIMRIQLARFGWEARGLDIPEIVKRTDSYTGSEIEQILISARYAAFGASEDFGQPHLLAAIGETVPLARTMSDRIEALRAWAKHRARYASFIEANGEPRSQDRAIELARSGERATL